MSAPMLERRLPARSRGGSVRVVDLSQTLSPRFPQIVLPPEFDQCAPFRMEEISRYDERGPGWYWNNLSFGEHTGTHFDAPVHWITGRDLPNNATDTMPPALVRRAGLRDRLLGRGGARRGFPAHRGSSARLGGAARPHPAGAWVLMRTDWSKRTDPVAYQNFDETGQHTPGPDASAVRFLVDERDVLGFGTETIGTDAGQAAHFRPPYPCHTIMHGAGTLRPAMPRQSRSAAADRRDRDRGAAEDPARQRQPGARARAGGVDLSHCERASRGFPKRPASA